ncbi:MAG: OmpA family protein [Bacteroidetes bacterium]|nr:OmpA family protein [Bacteroidota bacterium]
MQRFFIVYCLLFSCYLNGQNSVNIDAKDKLVEYELTPLNKINTKKSEFGAVKYGEGIVFVGEQKEDLVNLEATDVDGHPYLDLFFSKKEEGKFSKKKVFSRSTNTSYHDGPISFSFDLNEAYLTRTQYHVEKNKSFVNQSKLYFMTKKGTSWSKPKKFIYDSDEYSLGHASVSKDGKYLFFSSDMPGGYGGTDLYVCERAGDSWAKPVNLGPSVNSLGNELFPCMRKDGMLFFSSDKHVGFGGLDIFSATQVEGKWVLNRNEGLGINSPSDDFAIYFADSVNGYVSSNRNGSDDIFSFVFTQKYIEFEGFVLNSKDLFDPSENIKLELKDSLGNPIATTRTDKDGYFKFSSLKTNEKYLVDIDENDSLFSNMKHYYFADKNHSIVRVSGANSGDKFVFKNLPSDPNALPDMDLDDDKILAGNLLFNDSPSLPISNTKIVAKDKNGNIIDETTTNQFGAFVFTKIPPGESILIEIVESDSLLAPGTKIYLTNNKGKTLLTTTAGENGKFSLNLLNKDKTGISEMLVEDSDISLSFMATIFNEDNVTIPNLKVFLKDESGKIISTQTTDGNGKIKFNTLMGDKNYIVEFDENDTRLSRYKKIIIKSDDGKTTREVLRNEKGFEFHVLKGDKNDISEMLVKDTDIALNFMATVYNEDNVTIPNLKVFLKDEAGKVISTQTTDGNGKIKFNKLMGDQSYVVEFDEDDSRLSKYKKIIIKSDDGRVTREIIRTEKGFEYHILKGEKTNISELSVDDTDMLLNFKTTVYDENKNPIPNLIVYLKDENRSLLKADTTDGNGKINFDKLLAEKSYVIEFNEDDARLANIKKITLKSADGKVIKEIYRNEKGFEFHILKGEENELTDIYIDDPWLDTVNLNKNPKNSSITIEEKLYYAYGDYQVDDAGKKVLDKVIKIMKDNPQITIELSSHTDSRSTDEFNMQLSKKRAQSAVTYIAGNGVNKNRLKAIGFGETKLKNKCGNDVSCTEEEHAVNRRTEFKVINLTK